MEEADSPWLDIDLATLHRVDDPEQAAVVADPTRSAFLRPFLGRELSVSQAAAEVGCAPGAMLYRVRRMVGLRLLRVVRTVSRPGRPIKMYRSVHDGYFVPMDVMRYDDLRHRVATQGRTLVRQLVDSYTSVLATSATSGRVLARNRRGDVWASDLLPLSNDRGQPAFFGDLIVRLTENEAASLRDLMLVALDRALTASREPNVARSADRPYLVIGAVLPTT